MFDTKFSPSGGSFKAKFSSSKNDFDSEFNSLQVLKGEDGFSPIVDIQKKENGYAIDITDKEGKESFEITNGVDGYTPIKGVDYFDGIDGKDGTDGRDGVDGKDGVDGYTPIKGVDYFDGKDGVNGIDGRDGKDGYTPIKGIDYFDGTNGRDGIDGKDGYTPIKGTDYFTEEDVQEIVGKVTEEMPTPVTSWNDLTDKPFGEDVESITLTEFVAPMLLSFANGKTSAFERGLEAEIANSGGFVVGKTYGVSLGGKIYECICVTVPTQWGGTLTELKAVGEHGVNVYCSIASYYHYVSAPVTDGTHLVAIYEMTRAIKRLDEKFLPESVVLESELEGKGYQTKEQVKTLIDEATAEGGDSVISWNDLTDKPDFAPIATSGSWNDLEDKPFEEETIEETMEFDGDLTDKEYYEGETGVFAVKMTDASPTIEELLGATITVKHNISSLGANNGEEVVASFICNEENIQVEKIDESNYIIIVIFAQTAPALFIIHGDLSSIGLFTEGTYFLYQQLDEEYFYTHLLSDTKKVVHKIEEKYLPDNLVKTEQLTPFLSIRKTFLEIPSGHLWKIAYGNNKFVAVGYGMVIYSEDGVHWNEAPSQEVTISFEDVAYGNGRFVAVGNNGKAAYSDDGLTWVKSEVPGTSVSYRHIAYGNGRFVATSFNTGKAIYSEDGVNWNESFMGSSSQWSGLIYGNSRFVVAAAATGDNTVMCSEDGIIWSRSNGISLSHNNSYLSSPIYGNGRFLICESTTTRMFVSENGVDWDIIERVQRYYPNCYGNGKFVAVEEGGNAAYSEDGITWEETTLILNNPAYDDLGQVSIVGYGNGRFVALFRTPGVVFYSDDGINWKDYYEEIVQNGSVVSLNGNLSLDDYVTEEQVTTLIDEALMDIPDGGVTSWNDLTDKPFGEMPPVFDIKWDGVIGDKFALDLSPMGIPNTYAVKVSDSVFTAEELDGALYTSSNGNGWYVNSDTIDTSTYAGALELNGVIIVYDSSSLNAALGTPEGYITNGTYFICVVDEYYINRLVAPTVIKKLDNKYLDLQGYTKTEDLSVVATSGSWNDLKDKPFGEIPPAFDIQWDGDMTGREVFDYGDGTYDVKVSGQVFTKEQLLNSTLFVSNGYEFVNTEDNFDVSDEYGAIFLDYCMVIFSAETLNSAAGFPEGTYTNGVWFVNWTGEESYYVNRLVAAHAIKTLDNKYLDLEGYAKTEDLEGYAKTEDLEGYAKTEDLEGYAKTEDLSAVAKSGSYNDLADKPNIPTSYNDLNDRPNLAQIATSGSWNDLEDKPFGEGLSKWVEVVSRFKVTPTQADNGSYTATVELSFEPKVGTKYKIKVMDGLWTSLVICDHECVGYVSTNYPIIGYTRYGLGASGDPVYAYSSVPHGTIPTHWTFEFQSYNGQNGYYVEIYEAKPTLILLDEKYLPDSVVLESEIESKGYQTEEQVTALINNALGVIENGSY